jgi:hypothetical protein
MRGDLADTDWYSLLREQNTEEAWESIKGRLTSLTAKFVPLQKRRPPDRPIWMNKEILRAMSRKKRLWRKLRRGDNSTEQRSGEEATEPHQKCKEKFGKKACQRQGEQSTILRLPEAENYHTGSSGTSTGPRQQRCD